jgi:septum site-determining protein MinC
VKGREDGLRVTVSDAPAAEVEASLRGQLQRRAAAFFGGAPVVLEMPPGGLDLALAQRLAAIVEKAGMRVTAVVEATADRDRRRVGAARGAYDGARDSVVEGERLEALVVPGTVGDGRRVVHDGSVVVLGDVEEGAEILAGGSVLVWGSLRGVVEAGLVGGAADAVVCALDLAPTQLRIGRSVARAPDEAGRQPVPEVAREADGLIVVEAWRPAGGEGSHGAPARSLTAVDIADPGLLGRLTARLRADRR